MLRTLLLVLFLISRFDLFGQKLSDNFFVYPVAHDLLYPTSIVFLPDSSVLISEKDGVIWILENGNGQLKKFFNITCNTEGERGIQSLAVHPDFKTHPFVYVYYTKHDGSRNVLSRIKTDSQYEAESEEVIYQFDSLRSAIIHNGGGMKFASDGTLFLAIGDQNAQNSQDLCSYNGKLLRMNADGSVPEGNPYTTGCEATKRIWSLGLRNPYSLDIDPQTGRILVNDVGRVEWEEINDATSPGRNFGWPFAEGNSEYENYVDPIHTYPNNGNRPQFDITERGCAITGGAFVNPDYTNYPSSFYGKYFFIDYCNGWINLLDPSTNQMTNFSTGLSGGSLKSGPDGCLYFVNFYGGQLYKIIYTEKLEPAVLASPRNIRAVVGESVTLKAHFSGAPPYAFQWQKDNVDLPDQTAETLTIAEGVIDDSGDYTLIIKNAFGADTTSISRVTVNNNVAPVAKINIEGDKKTYSAGDTIRYSGEAHDIEDGALPSGRFQWICSFHHNTHSHPGPPLAQQTANGYFVIPSVGETDTDVWYRVILIATDSKGAPDTTFLDLKPKLIKVSVNSIPAGATVLLDKQKFTTPFTFLTVAGVRRILESDTLQSMNGANYYFTGWNGFSRNKSSLVISPSEDISYTARLARPPEFQIHQPLGYTALENTPFTIHFPHTGSAPLIYSWTKDGRLLAHADSVLSFSKTSLSDAGIYELTVSNEHSSVVSRKYELNVRPSSLVKILSRPSGLGIFMNNQFISTPHAQYFAEGEVIDLSAQLYHQTPDQPDWFFYGWNDQRSENISYSVSANDTTLIAKYENSELFRTATIYPNPFTGDCTLAILAESASKAKVVVTDIHSSLLLSTDHELKIGFNPVTLNMQSFKTGIYVVRIFYNNSWVTRRVTKLE